jgi:hypothetical protein
VVTASSDHATVLRILPPDPAAVPPGHLEPLSFVA